MIPIKQKEDDYCIVACIVSILLDKGNETLIENIKDYDTDKDNSNRDNLQDILVKNYPEYLNKTPGRKGFVENFEYTVDILMKLGITLSQALWRFPNEPEKAIIYFLNNKHIAERILIYRKAGTHCVRLMEVKDYGIIIMEPMDGKETLMNWDEFKNKDEYRGFAEFLFVR